MELKVNGMTCAHCVKTITTAMNELGINDVQVSLEQGTVLLGETNEIESEKIKEIIEDLGYDVE